MCIYYFNNSLSHYNVCKFIKLVLDAFVTSVKWFYSFVKFHINQQSIVPNNTFPLFKSFYISLLFYIIHFILYALKYVFIGNPVFY